jgi:hypothetical protein
MASRNEITTAIAYELLRLDYPGADPKEEVELTGNVSNDFVNRSEGEGIARVRYGPRYAFYWREAQKLAIAVELAKGLR